MTDALPNVAIVHVNGRPARFLETVIGEIFVETVRAAQFSRRPAYRRQAAGENDFIDCGSTDSLRSRAFSPKPSRGPRVISVVSISTSLQVRRSSEWQSRTKFDRWPLVAAGPCRPTRISISARRASGAQGRRARDRHRQAAESREIGDGRVTRPEAGATLLISNSFLYGRSKCSDYEAHWPVERLCRQGVKEGNKQRRPRKNERLFVCIQLA